jgi:predicted negative regulator of RcsB-dependent stress response
VEVYRTEQEQVEALRLWFKNNGSAVFVAICLAVALVFGWQGWQDYRRNQVDAASIAYNGLLEAFDKLEQSEGADKAAKEELEATVAFRAKALSTEHQGTTYATYASLLVAARAVTAGNLDVAQKELDTALASTSDETLKKLINLRLARVKFAQGKADDALALANNDGGIFQFGYEQLKGDIYLEKGDRTKARDAYKAAQQLQQKASKNPDRLLDMKLKAVAEPDAAMLADLPATQSAADQASAKKPSEQKPSEQK